MVLELNDKHLPPPAAFRVGSDFSSPGVYEARRRQQAKKGDEAAGRFGGLVTSVKTPWSASPDHGGSMEMILVNDGCAMLHAIRRREGDSSRKGGCTLLLDGTSLPNLYCS